MRKNRSTWAALLSVVLALVVMASLAVTSFAETEGRVPTDAELSAVLSGSASPTAGINFDVDGNGIVEWDDLACLRGEQKDPMPNGEEDIFSLLNENNKTDAHLQSAIVLGDSSKAAGLNGKLGTTATLVFKEAVDFTGYANLKFDIFWRSTNGALKVTLTSGGKDYEIPVTPAKAGWSAAVAEIPEDARAAVTKITFTLTGGEEGSVAYIDNIRTGDKAITTNVVFNSDGGSAVATKTYNVGATYGELPVPVKTFYTFEGWYLNGEKVTADTVVVAAENGHTLLAKWSKIVSDDGTITLGEPANNAVALTMDGSYKQIRFQFKVHSGTFGLSYVDGDSTVYNNPVITIVDATGKAVSNVQNDQWYTAIIYGGSVVGDGVIYDGVGMAKTATLSMGNANVEVKHLETLIGQYGLRMLGRNESWGLTDSSDVLNGKIVNGYDFNMDANNRWDSRIDFTTQVNRYNKVTWDFYVYEHATAAAGETYGMGFNGDCLNPSIYDMDGNPVAAEEMKVGTWYHWEVDLTGKTGSQYIYFYQSDAAVAAGHFKAYLTNVNFIGNGSLVDNLDPAISVTADKAGTAGSFATSPVTRDTDRGTFYVKNDSANWSDRVIRVTRNDTTKELIQVDFRFVTSKDASGKDIAPTLKVSTTLTGTLKQAQYVILDQNDTPVTALETGKWYRLFIYANGSNTFGLVPATTGEVELQLEGLETFNADELPVTMISGNPALGSVSAVLTRFGKMQYAYAGTAANAMTLTLDKNTYKQVRFSFRMQEKVAAIVISGANLTIKDAGGKVVTTSGLKVGDWYTAVILNNSNALPKNLLMQISGGTAMTIKDLVAYETVADPADKTASDIFRGLDSDEMMLSGFIGPREEVYVGYYAYDQKADPKASLARDEIFKLLAEAGLNYITDSGVDYNGASTESTEHILRLAAKYGITYYPSVSSIASIGADTGKTEKVKFLHENGYSNSERDRKIYTETFVSSDVAASAKLLLELYQYESFGGVYLRDEPASDLFDEVASAVAHINAAKEYANKKYGVQMLLSNYVNMLCFYNRSGSLDNFTYYKNPVTGATATRGLSWQQYLTYSVEHIGMNYISFDIYPVTTSGIDSGFLNYLGAVANVSKETNGTPWMGYAQVGGGVPAYDSKKKEVTQSELYWDVNTMLAFGAKGILYYIGVTPQYYVEPNSAIQQDHSLIDNEGNTTQYYEVVKGINEQIQAMDHVLMKSTFNGVITNGRGACSYTSGGSDAGTSFGSWSMNNSMGTAKLSSVGGTASLIGVFDYNGKTALLVMNNTVNTADSNDAGKEGTINLTFNSGNYTYEIIQDATTSWATGTNLGLSLLPGRCALVVVHENAVEQELNVEFFLNYNTDVPGPEAITISMVNGQYVYPELPTPADRMFYTFAGWYAVPNPKLEGDNPDMPVKTGEEVISTADHALYAVWKAAQVEITFNIGDYPTAESIDGIVLNVNGTYGELPIPVRPYHTFGGWYLDAACTGDAVTADTKVTISHTLYAKWIEDEDSSLLKFTSGNAETASVYRDGIGQKDTVVYTTEGKQLDGNGYGRPVKMVLSDTSKEVIKFRFQFASCDANLEKLTFNYLVKNADVNNGNYGNYVVLDKNGNVTYEYEVGKWYTFYGVTLGYENLYLWPVTNTTEQINVTMYFQDREALDYEPEVNIHQENTAYYGNTAPYQDAQGNWLVHYRSFTGSGVEGVLHHNNSAWDRRTYIDIPANYTHASFEFRFNVSQYAAAGAELADKIVAFEYMRAYYTDLDGNPVAVEDMEVGTWYRATFGNPIPESGDYTIAMGTVQPGSGAVVNIDMDYRNVQCYTHETDYSFTRYYYTNIYYGAAGGQLAHMLRTPYHTDGTNAIDRRVMLNVANNSGDLISMKVYFTECSGTPAMAIANGGSGAVSYTIMDANGNAADGNNLKLNQWYTVSWVGDGSESYQLRPFVGTAVNGTFFVRDVKVQQAENPFRVPTGGEMYVTNAAPAGSSGYYSSVTPVVIGDEVAYKHYIWATNDGTNGRERRAHLVVTAAEKQIVSMRVYFDSCSTGATPSIQILRSDATALCYLVTDADGNVVDGNNLQTGKWYTVSWIAESGQTNYRIYPITGTKGYGTYYMKDISVKSVEGPLSSTYYAWVLPYATGSYMGYVRPTGDGTNISHRQINLAINSAARDTISLDMQIVATSGTQLLKIVNAAGAEMAITIVGKDDGIAVDSTAMELDKWYTVSWTSDGSASYGIRTFDGSAVNGKYFVKNIQNTPYVPAVYDVSFNLGYEGATAPETIQVTEGNAYGVLPVPARQDYIFGGWYLEAECINAVTAESIVNSTHTLYAKWIKASVMVSFNYGDAEAREVNVGEAYGELPVVADRLGYIFGGWYLDAECTAEVTADTIVTKTESHTLYAKWIAKADTNEELTVVVGNATTTDVLFDTVGGKETAIYTTEGKQLDGNGYGRPVKMVLSDTSKEVIKFRFQFASCDADLEKLTFNYTVGVLADVNSGNYGNYVVLDEEGNITYEYEVGKWYTFYGLTLGNANLYWWPVTNTEEQINVTMYFQDREVLDYEPDVNIRQEGTAYFGNAAPYQDAEGNWLVHYRSFTGSGAEGVLHHNNTAWDRRTYIDIPTTYNYASFEFRFNVSQYAAAGEELATHIEGFGYLGATYFDMNGTPVAVSDMVVGQWYRAVFANPIPESGNFTIAMGFKNGGSGATVNIDMDYRNAYGFNSAELSNPFLTPAGGDMYNTNTPAGPSGYYSSVTPIVLGDEVIYKHYIWATGDGTNSQLRRTHLTTTAAEKQVISMKVYFESCSATPSLEIFRSDKGAVVYVVSDANGNVVDPLNLQVGQWYTVSWLADKGITEYRIQPITGSAANGTYYMKDINVQTVEGLLTSEYYGWVMPYAEGQYLVNVRVTGDPTGIGDRKINLNIANTAQDVISMNIKMTETSGTQLLKVKNASGAEMAITICDAEGNIVDSTAMVLGQWYTVSWRADGSAKYTIHAFDGSAVGGKYFLKNIEVAPYVPEVYDVSFNLGYEGEAPATIQVVEGNAYGVLPEVSRTNYIFGGWYLEAECINAVNAEMIVTGTHTLYAKWIEATVTITFNYGDVGAQTVKVGEPYGELPVVADRLGYIFGGWYLDAEYTAEVTADTIVTKTEDHTIYAKWTANADTNEALKVVVGNETTTAVLFDMVDGKETAIYTTEGKLLDGNGYGRPVKMVLADTSKEVVKFRFQFASCDANLEKLTFNYLVGVNADINNGNYGNYVVLDEEGNITYEYEVGKWYTFYGLTLGNENLYWWPVTNTTEQINVTMYFQDREALDYEPNVNIHQEGTAYYGNAAPYQDAEGNWLVHYRSFTGSGAEGALQHANSGWNRRTYIDIPEGYDYASFEFRFNVSQYAAAGAELADRIEAFYGLNATYFDMNGTPVAVSDMVVGQWYRAVFAPVSYFIAMSDVNGGSGATVNIDMDYRNAYGFNSAEVTNPFTYDSNIGTYYGAVTPVVLGDEVIYKHTLKYTTDSTNDNHRRVDLNMSGSDKQIMSMKVYFESVEHGGVPSIRVFRSDAGVLGYVVTDAQGNVVDPMNLELKQWYTVTWLANGGIEKYQIRPYTGASASGTYYMKDITMTDYVASDVLVGGYYTWVLDVPGTDTHMVHVRYTGDGTNIDAHRFATLNINSGARDTISADIMIGAYGTNSLLKVKNASGAELSFTIVDSEGNAVESTAMVKGQWYTLSWTADGSATYKIHSFDGEKLAGNGTYYLKNIEVAPYVAAEYDVSFDLGYEGEAPATITVVEGNAYGELPAPTRPGYTFNGWYLSSGEAVTAQTIATATEAHTLYAKWTCNVSFSYPTEVYLASPTGTYYASVAETTVDGEVAYEYSNQTANFHSGVTAYYRRVILNIDDFMGGTVSMKVKFTSVKALDGTALDTTKLVITPINGDDTPIALTVTDENGVTVAADAMAIGQWYTISFTGLGTRSYDVRPFNEGGENGIFLMKDFQVTKAAVVDDFNPTLRFAITSDVHIYNRYQNSWPQKAHLNNLLDVAYGYANASSYTNLDAFLVAGDISEGTAGIENVEDEFVTFKKIVDGAIKPGTQFLVGMGNHDYRKNGSYEDAGALEMEELFKSTFGLDSTDQHVVINGYHFIVLSPEPTNQGLRVGESYTAEKLAWLEAELEIAKAADPNKPIFVMQHHHASGTVYGSGAEGGNYQALYNVLAKYPQVVDFSGHSHWPINDPRNIWQGAFTALGTGTLYYTGMNLNGVPGHIVPDGYQGDYTTTGNPNAPDYAMFQIIEMNAAGDMRVIVYDLNSFTEVCRYVISNPVTNKDYTVGQQDVPVFEEDTDVYYEDGYVYFQQATSDDVIESYRAEVYEGETLIGTYYGLSGYIYPNRTPEYLRIKVGELVSVNGFTVKIYAVNINNELSAPIELAIEPVIIQSTVDFNLGYAGAESVDSIIVTAGLPYGNLPTPADREYHTFGGWYLDAACTGEAVTADTIVTASVNHTLYAKWTEKEDTTGLKFTIHNATTTDIYRETIGGKETVVYTTEGKQLDGNGYGRPVKMVLADTSKEVIKFRFQFVSCDANLEKLTFNYLVGVNTDANSGNYGNYVVLDENGNATYEFEVGKWYTFYGRTLGNSNLYLWPVTNTTEKINIKMYFQDREVLDYEPDVNIRQEGTAFFGNAAPYQDAEGNWLVHYRSFTGSGAEGALQHNNTAWDRRTYLDIPATYDYASFEFRFNVSQYAAAGAELADKIVAFEYLKATYFDMNGTPISVADMVVGQWYRAVFANPIPTSTNYTIVMGTVQPGSGAIVNIDMDFRNAQGYTIGEITNPFLTPGSSDLYNTNTPAGPSGYYSSVTPIVLGDEVIYKHYIKSTSDGTNAQLRRTHLSISAAEKKIISMQVYFESCSATPSLEIYRKDKGVVGFVITDANGNIADRMNLQTKQWYTVTWIAESGISHYRVQPITGSAANGTYYMKDITVSDPVASDVLTGNYYTWIRPVVETNSYMVHARYTGDGTNIGHREAILAISSASGELISMDINVAATSGTRLLKVLNASGTEMAIAIVDADGNAVDSSAMEFGKWYTLSWISDGSATYKIRSFDGSAANGTYYLKNIQSRQVENPYTVYESYYANVTPYASGNEVGYKYASTKPDDARWNNTGVTAAYRRVHLNIAATSNEVISMRVMLTSVWGYGVTTAGESLTTSKLVIHEKGASQPLANVAYIDDEGNIVACDQLEVGKWYTVTFAGTGAAYYEIRPFDAGGEKGIFYMKDIKVEDAVAVSFNLNFPEKSDNKGTVTQIQTAAYVEGKPYGALFTPDLNTVPSYRRTSDGTVMNYSFGGWYTDAACTGEPVKATDLVVSGTTLHAKWINASYVVENNYPTTLAYNDGEWVYTNTVTVGKNLFQLRVPDTTYAVTYQIMLHDCDEGVNAVLTGYSAHRVWVDGERLTSGKTMTLEAGKWYTITFAHTTSSTTLVGAENAGYWGVMNVGTGSGTLKVSVKNVQTQSTPLT